MKSKFFSWVLCELKIQENWPTGPEGSGDNGARGLYGPGPGAGPSGHGGGRGAGGLRHCKRRRGGGEGPQPAGDRPHRPGPRRDRGHPSGLRHPGGVAADGLHPVCHSGALPHVRRGHRQRPYPGGVLRGQGRQGRVLRLGAQSV